MPPFTPSARASRDRCATLTRVPLGVYVHVPFCATRCAYCDFNTYTARRARRLGRRRDRRGARCGARPSTAAGVDRLLRGRDADAAAARGLVACCARSTRARPGAGRRGHRRGEPRQRRSAIRRAPRAGGVTRVSLGMQSGAAHVLRPWAARTRRARGRGGARGASGRLRAREPRPHLRQPGRERRGLAGVARGGAARRARPRERLRADGRAGHAAARRRPARARPRPTRTRWPSGTRCRRTARGAGLQWYEVSSWAPTTTRAAITTSPTGRAATGGASARARTRTSAAGDGGTSGTRRRGRRGSPPGSRRRRGRGARRRAAPARAAHARGPHAQGPSTSPPRSSGERGADESGAAERRRRPPPPPSATAGSSRSGAAPRRARDPRARERPARPRSGLTADHLAPRATPLRP